MIETIEYFQHPRKHYLRLYNGAADSKYQRWICKHDRIVTGEF